MPKVKQAVFAVCPTGGLAAGCSFAEPAPKDFVLVDQRPAMAKETGNTLEKAELKCQEQTKKKGIGSLAGIFTHLRKGGGRRRLCRLHEGARL